MSEGGGHSRVESVLANPESLIVIEPAPEYGAGRRCAHDGCITTLSRYHEGDYCYLHEDEQYDARTVAMEYTEDGNRPCYRCGRNQPPTLRFWFADERSKDGLDAVCKSCRQEEMGRVSERQKDDARKSDWNRQNRAKVNAWKKKWRDANPGLEASYKRKSRSKKKREAAA